MRKITSIALALSLPLLSGCETIIKKQGTFKIDNPTRTVLEKSTFNSHDSATIAFSSYSKLPTNSMVLKLEGCQYHIDSIGKTVVTSHSPLDIHPPIGNMYMGDVLNGSYFYQMNIPQNFMNENQFPLYHYTVTIPQMPDRKTVADGFFYRIGDNERAK